MSKSSKMKSLPVLEVSYPVNPVNPIILLVFGGYDIMSVCLDLQRSLSITDILKP